MEVEQTMIVTRKSGKQAKDNPRACLHQEKFTGQGCSIWNPNSKGISTRAERVIGRKMTIAFIDTET